MSAKLDLIKTISEGDEVPNYSDSSDDDEEFQPSKQKEKKKKDFEVGFEFVGSTAEYNKDVWNDLAKYVKKKISTRVDEKIAEARKKLLKKEKERKNKKADSSGEDKGNETEEESSDSEVELGSESEVEIGSDSEDEVGSESEDEKGKDSSSGVSSNGSDDEDMSDINDEMAVSDDELVKDKIRDKEKHLGKRTRKKIRLQQEEKKIEFEDAPPYDENISFYEMNLSRPLLKAISAMNYLHPTPIQAATIPIAMQGRDICGCAATGTGKTAAYMLPTLERLIYKPGQIASVTRVLVLVPTRELGVQVYQVTKQLSQFINVDVALSVGGLDLKVQEAALRRNPDVVIATPGRLIDHLRNTPSFSLSSVEVLILDEADRMLDEYFEEQMTEIIKQCCRSRQTLLFSATMTEAVDSLAAVSLNKPVRLFVDNNQDVASNLRQEFIKVRKEREGDREPLLAALVCRTFHDHCMVFVQTKKQAHRLHILLGLLGVKVGEIHGDLNQTQRLEALSKFRKEEIDVLVATDVAARGLDIPGVKTVINFLMPATLEHYIHRVGRTARAGRGGVSVSLAGESERQIIKQVLKNSKIPVKARTIPPEILDKYRKKVEKLEDNIKEILDEEYQEKALLKLEAQTNKAEKMLKSSMEKKKKKGGPLASAQQGNLKREWFQTHQQKNQEKARLRLNPLEPSRPKKSKRNSDDEDINEVKARENKKKKKKGPEKPEDRVAREMEKVALLQARAAKRRARPKKLRTVYDRDEHNPRSQMGKRGKAKKKSSFAAELTDVSQKGVKFMRHDANKNRRNNQGGNDKKKGASYTNKNPFGQGKKGRKK